MVRNVVRVDISAVGRLTLDVVTASQNLTLQIYEIVPDAFPPKASNCDGMKRKKTEKKRTTKQD